MPLLDHFHRPLSEERSWESFHAAWAGSLADDLNRRLPEGYFAEEMSGAGLAIEIDVATMERSASVAGERNGPGVSLTETWAPPAPAHTLPAEFVDDFEVRVFSTGAGPRLVAAIELVSPRNKDRASARRAFSLKCASYLSQGIGLIVVDVVTGRRANMHNEILQLLETSEVATLPPGVLYAVGYGPVRREGRDEIDIWPATLAVDQPLPTLPLLIGPGTYLPLDLEAAYTAARERRRLA